MIKMKKIKLILIKIKLPKQLIKVKKKQKMKFSKEINAFAMYFKSNLLMEIIKETIYNSIID